MIKNLAYVIGRFTLLGIFIIGLSGCFAEKHPAVNAHMWAYKANAINIHVEAPRKLNTLNGRSHTLLLAVVQVSELQAVQSLLDTSEGIATLLEKVNTQAEAKSLFISKLFVVPGERKTIQLTRMAGMKHVVIVAGYNQLNPGQVIKIFNIPIGNEIEGIKFWKRIYMPVPLHVKLNLGKQGIASAYSREQ